MDDVTLGLFQQCISVLTERLESDNVRLRALEPWPRGYKTFLMLNSAEHEIFNAHKYKNRRKFSTFYSQIRL